MAVLVPYTPPPTATSRGADPHAWSQQQVEALRAEDFAAVDWDGVIEEIETVGTDRRAQWEGVCAAALRHLLKMEHHVGAWARSLNKWRRAVDGYRGQMHSAIRQAKSLRWKYDEMLENAWRDGRRDAIRDLVEYGVGEDPLPQQEKECRREWRSRLPERCPYQLEHVTANDPIKNTEPDEDVWPPAVARRLNEELGTDYPILEGREIERDR